MPDHRPSDDSPAPPSADRRIVHPAQPVIGGGECAELIRRFPWQHTPVGAIDEWTPMLCSTVTNIVNSPIPKVLMWGHDAHLIYNDAYAVIAGPRHPSTLGARMRDAWPEIWDWSRSVLEAGFRGEQVSHHDRPMIVTRTGEPEQVVFDLYYTPVYEIDGQVGGVMCTVIENTQRVRAERELARQIAQREHAEDQLRQWNETLEARVIAEIDERRKAEARLVQAQKMEAVGKLTGGIAHDFNNLLQVVAGNLQLLAKEIVGNERAERRAANAMAGVARGAKLASQLLAFGRRQALEPKVINVTRLVRGMDDMLRRAIGNGIEVETICADGLWNTFIDPVQVESALLNLAINARDAMQGSGKLTIAVGNVHLDDAYATAHDDVTAGQYVQLAVTDTGCGMPPDVITRAFDPFFTTKPEGQGSGLGLSMVYGFVKQSGGHVKIQSEPGDGTTISLYLPRALQAEDQTSVRDADPVHGGTETILVVEDDEEVRAIVADMLADLGYRVLEAHDATEALRVVESGEPIDLLFTDVVMPGPLKPPELARKARERIPGLPVLFTSGYSENSIVHGGRLDPGVELLTKPYPREALARKVRRVLGAWTTPREPLEPAGAPRGASVLVVETDELIRLSTADLLADAGHPVRAAANVRDALAMLRDAPADVLLTTIDLPGASGLELARLARDLLPGIAVVFAASDIDVARADPGAVLLAKPYGADELLGAVGAAAAERRPA